VFTETSSLPGTVDLWAYASDAETPVAELTYELYNTPSTGAGVTLEGNRYVRTDPSADWCGYADVTVRATDPGVQDLPAGGGKRVSLTAGEWQVT
jgi:hypothetical protein